MTKLFMGKTPSTDFSKNIDNTSLPSYILTILSEGGFSTVSGIEGLDGNRPPGWNLADNSKHIIFDSRIDYLRKLSSSNFKLVTLGMHPKNSAGIAIYPLSDSIKSQYSTAICIGRIIGTTTFGPSAQLSTGGSMRFISFNSITDDALNTTPVLVEQWSGFSDARNINIEYQLMVGY